MRRLFIAIQIEPDPELIKLVETLKSKLRHDRITWINTNNLHLTLKFIGETNEEFVEAITIAMQKAASTINPFEIRFDKLGLFGSSYDPRVIWIGSIQLNEAVNRLGENVLNELNSIGFKRDRQNFVSHLTIGRIKELSDKSYFQDVIKSQPQIIFQTSLVKKIILFESILRREGPIYKEISVVELKG